MVISQGNSNSGFGWRGVANKGINPASTMPNYSVMNPHAQATYKNNMGQNQRNPQSDMNGTYSMSNTRLPNQYADVDAPKGIDQVWQVVDERPSLAEGRQE